MLKRKLEFFRTVFAVILSAMALLVVQTFELNFEIILYITIFVLSSSGSCFKSAICIQNPLNSAPTLYLPSKASLISVSELSGPKTTAWTPFPLTLDTWFFFITRQTVSTSLSPCLTKPTQTT